MDLRQLSTFQAVVDAGNFARAAQRLGIGPSTVTLHIQQLESSLGGPVFIRRGRRLGLTELGMALRPHADAIARHVGAIADEAAGLASAVRGTVRIGGIEPLAHLDLMPLLARVRRERPNVTLLLEVGGTALLATSVAEGRLAFAVCSAPPAELGLGFEPLLVEPIGLLLPAGHELARDGDVAAERLGGQPIVLSEPGCAYRGHVIATFRDLGIALDVKAEIGSAAATVEAVRAGVGIALLPTAGFGSPPAGTVTRRVEGVDLGLRVGIVRPRAGEPYSALTSQVLAAIRKSAPRWRSGSRALPSTRPPVGNVSGASSAQLAPGR
jgi:LysR family transcriptional regulator, regulator of the ytmI operon